MVSNCTICGANTINTGPGTTAASSCTACPANTVTPGSAATDRDERTDCVAPMGYFSAAGPGTPASPCPAGSYCSAMAATAPTVCGANTYSAAVAATSVSTCSLCPANTIAAGDTAADHDNITDCVANEGYFGHAGSSAEPCPAGSFSAQLGASVCTICGEKTFSTTPAATSSSTCLPCPTNTVTVGGALPSLRNELGDCVADYGHAGPPGAAATPCSAGSYGPGLGATACLTCDANTIAVSSAAESCQACPNNTVTVGSTPDSHDDLTDCVARAGFFGNPGSAASACAAGSYSSSPGATACSICPPNTFSTTAAANSLALCLRCPPNTNTTGPTAEHRDQQTDCVANIGYFGVPGSPAAPCPAGSFSTAFGSTACTTCGPNTYSAAFAASSSSTCQPCPANTVTAGFAPADRDRLTDCVADLGHSGLAGSAASPCPAGSFSATTNASICTVCGNGLYSVAIAATSPSTCVPCPANATTLGSAFTDHDGVMDCVADVGHFGPDGSPASPCPAGSFSAALGQSTCTLCGPNTTSSEIAARSAAACAPCPAFTLTVGLTTRDRDEATDCVSIAGYYGAPGTPAMPCPAGTFSSQSNTTALSGCLLCNVTSYSPNAGMSACLPCPPNTATPNATALRSNATLNCLAIPGYFGNQGTSAAPCPAGAYSESFGSTACTLCPPNTFSETVAAAFASTCLPCPANTVTVGESTGASAVTSCIALAGYFGGNGAPATPCPAGSFKSFRGGVVGNLSDCSLCPANSFSAMASAACSLCPGSTQTAASSAFSSRDSIDDCISNHGGHFFALQNRSSCPTTAAQVPLITVATTGSVSRLNSFFCDPADSDAQGWTSEFSSLRMAGPGCALGDGQVSLQPRVLSNGTNLIQITWQTGSPVGGMAAVLSMASAGQSIRVGCLAVSAAQICSFGIVGAGWLVQPQALAVPILGQTSYIMTVLLRSDRTIEARLYSAASVAAGDGLPLGSLTFRAAAVTSAWSAATVGFVNPAGNFSCVDRFEVYSICEGSERLVNGSCFGKDCYVCVCVTLCPFGYRVLCCSISHGAFTDCSQSPGLCFGELGVADRQSVQPLAHGIVLLQMLLPCHALCRRQCFQARSSTTASARPARPSSGPFVSLLSRR
jgi:hypothetical protein